MLGNLPLDSLDRFAEYQKDGPNMERRKFVISAALPQADICSALDHVR